jgi:citrate lyase beta subunit
MSPIARPARRRAPGSFGVPQGSETPPPPRARRTLLFVPADDAAKSRKAAAAGADSVILDLEDGVAADRKAAARQTAFATLRQVDFGRSERLVRINRVGSVLEAADLRTILPGRPDGVVIPKVESAAEVRVVARRTAALGVPLLALIETARGIVHLREIARAHPRLEALLFGAEDLAGDIGAVRTEEGAEIAWARGAVVVVAAAHDLQAIDTIFPDLENEEGLIREARLAARMGYAGKMAIHPGQLPVIADAFTPTDEEIARARRLTEAHARHQASGTGVFVLDGRMVDRPMVRAAERLLARARAAGKI